MSAKINGKKPHYDIVSVGSAVRDTMYYTDLAELVKNPSKDPTKVQLIAFEYGAKIRSDEVFLSVGGGAANTAVGIAKLGLYNAALVSVGKDVDGKTIEEHLQKLGVATDLVQYSSKYATGFSFVVIESTTHEHVAFAHYGANEDLRISPKLLQSFTTDWFYVSSLNMPHWEKMMKLLVNTSANIVWNPGANQLEATTTILEALLKKVYVLILNKDEATELALKTGLKNTRAFTEKILAQHLFTLGPSLVLITNGRKGSHVYDGKNVYFAKPSPDKPVDTTGAGDCFGSSFTTGLIRFKGDIQKALQLGIVNSTSLVAQVGAQSGLLTWRQANVLLKKI